MSASRLLGPMKPFAKRMLWMVIGVLIVALNLAPAQDVRPRNYTTTAQRRPATGSDARADSKKKQSMIREGTKLVDTLGHFKTTGDRATFFSSDGQHRLRGLENLALERVARVLSESSGKLEWSVSGPVTEYRGANYLLITRAVIKTKNGRRPSRR